MGLLDKATQKKQVGNLGARAPLPGRLSLSGVDFAELAAGLGALPRRAGYVFEAWKLLAEALPFDPFVLLGGDEILVPLARRRADLPAGLAGPGSLSDLCAPRSPRTGGGPSGESARRLASANPGTALLPLHDAEGKNSGHWLLGPAAIEPSSSATGPSDPLRRLFRVVEGSGVDFDYPATQSLSLFTRFLEKGRPGPVLGFRLSASSLAGALRGLELSEAGAALALSRAFRLALGEACLTTVSPDCLSFFCKGELASDGELLLAQFRKTLGRALPSFGPLAGADFQTSGFKAEDRSLADALLAFSGA